MSKAQETAHLLEGVITKNSLVIDHGTKMLNTGTSGHTGTVIGSVNNMEVEAHHIDFNKTFSTLPTVLLEQYNGNAGSGHLSVNRVWVANVTTTGFDIMTSEREGCLGFYVNWLAFTDGAPTNTSKAKELSSINDAAYSDSNLKVAYGFVGVLDVGSTGVTVGSGATNPRYNYTNDEGDLRAYSCSYDVAFPSNLFTNRPRVFLNQREGNDSGHLSTIRTWAINTSTTGFEMVVNDVEGSSSQYYTWLAIEEG